MLPQNGIIHPKQLAALTKTFQEYCSAEGIEPDTNEYREAGQFLIFLYENGVRDQDRLAKAMRARANPPVQ